MISGLRGWVLEAFLWGCARCGLTLTCWWAQYQFRMQALAGQLPGVRKASW